MGKPKSSKAVEPPAEAPVEDAPPADALGGRLRELFTTLEAAPVPEDLRTLVDALEKKRRGRREPRRN